MSKHHLHKVGELLRRASKRKGPHLCVKIARRGNATFTFFVTLVVHLKVEQRDQSYLDYVDKCHSVGLAVSCSSWQATQTQHVVGSTRVEVRAQFGNMIMGKNVKGTNDNCRSLCQQMQKWCGGVCIGADDCSLFTLFL